MSSMNIPKRQVDLLLMGKTGTGKSAAGNIILGADVFLSCSSTDSVTENISYGVTEHGQYIIKVVDGPGIGDTRMENQAGMEQTKNAMQAAIDLNVSGYHAFLFIARYGSRFEQGDDEAVKLLKKTFGANFLRDYGIIILTHGDNFEFDAKRSGITFMQWVGKQGGVFKQIVSECENRVLLFDNRTQDTAKATRQIDALLALVESLRFKGNRYCGEHFQLAAKDREKAMIEGKLPKIHDDTMVETSLIIQQLDKTKKSGRRADQLQPLLKLQTRADALCKNIEKQDKGTGALNKLKTTVDSIKQRVDMDVHACRMMIPEERNHDIVSKQKSNTIDDLAASFDGLKKEYEKLIKENAVLKKKKSCTIL